MPKTKPSDEELAEFSFRMRRSKRRREAAEKERKDASAASVQLFVEAREAGVPVKFIEKQLGLSRQYVNKTAKDT